MSALSLGRLGGTGAVLGRRSRADIARAVNAAQTADVTYPHVGSTTAGTAPVGVGVVELHRSVEGTLERARTTLSAWTPHSGIDAQVVPDGPPALDAMVCVVARWGPIEICAPNRIVTVIDEPDRFGFAYATLPGHPESGEELFLAEQEDGGRVGLSIVAHADPVAPAARLGAPLARAVQRAATRHYLDAWAEAVEKRPTG